jgi:hypothetical protein
VILYVHAPVLPSSSSGSAAGWFYSAGHRLRMPCCGTRSPCCAALIYGPGSTGLTGRSSPRSSGSCRHDCERTGWSPRPLGVTANPGGSWTTQEIRNLLIRDRAGQFTAAFDTVLADAGIVAVKIPPRSPRANGQRPHRSRELQVRYASMIMMTEA